MVGIVAASQRCIGANIIITLRSSTVCIEFNYSFIIVIIVGDLLFELLGRRAQEEIIQFIHLFHDLSVRGLVLEARFIVCYFEH